MTGSDHFFGIVPTTRAEISPDMALLEEAAKEELLLPLHDMPQLQQPVQQRIVLKRCLTAASLECLILSQC